MVRLILCTLLLMTFNAQSGTYSFDQISAIPDFQINFLLENSRHSKYYGNLDCQSFIKKLDIYNSKGDLMDEEYIGINGCEFIYLETASCLEKNQPKCINTNDLFKPGCDC